MIQLNAEFVIERIAQGLRIVINTSGRIGPKMYGNSHPEIVRDFSDRISEFSESLEEWLQNIERQGKSMFTADEVAAGEEALTWPLKYLGDNALGRDAVWLKAMSEAVGLNIERTLRKRRSRADSMVTRRSTELPDKIVVYDDADAIATDIVQWANAAIGKAKGPVAARRIRQGARIRFARAIRAAGAVERIVVVRRPDVMPNRHFNVGPFYKSLWKAAETIADRLKNEA